MIRKGVFLIALSYVISKSVGNLLTIFVAHGDWIRKILYEITIWLNLFIGYKVIQPIEFKKVFLKMGIMLDSILLCTAFLFNILTPPQPIFLMQCQLMLRELLLSPLFYFGFVFLVVRVSRLSSWSLRFLSCFMSVNSSCVLISFLQKRVFVYIR